MSELYEINKVASREPFPGGPNENPGIRLMEGYLPGWTFADVYKYAHVAEVTRNNEVKASTVDAIAKETGQVLLPGIVIIMDTSVEPPQFRKCVGEYVLKNNILSYKPAGL